jgi:predicted dehydrogenase
MPKLGVGIIGLGVGEQHIEGVLRKNDCEVTLLCDFDLSKRNLAKQKYPEIKIVESAEDLIQDPAVDVVSIASYDNFHFDQVEMSLRLGKHVFVEKPLCLHVHEALKIRSLLEENPVLRLSSNLILRRSPRFQYLKDLILKNELGRLYHIEGSYLYGRLSKLTEGWRGKIDYYSVVLGGAVHIIDLILWLTNEKAVEVTAYGNRICTDNSQFHHPDFVSSLIKFESGLIATVSANFGCVLPHHHALNIYGTKGTFLNEKTAKLFKSADPSAPPQLIDIPYPGVRKGELLENFLSSLMGETAMEVTQEDVFRTMSVCFAIEKSVKEGHPVRVEYI